MSQSKNQAPNPPSAAEPQPKPGGDRRAAPAVPLPRKRVDELESSDAEADPQQTPVNPEQSDG